nr:beta-propeller domain-containing protein [Priestia megaterium]
MNKQITGLLFLVILLCSVGIFYSLTTNKVTANIPNATSYATAAKIWTIHFNKEMDPNSITQESVTIRNENNEPLSISFDWEESNTILKINAENGYQQDHTYQINISNRVKTAKGDYLSDALTHTFTVVNDIPKIKDAQQLITILKERSTMTIKEESANTAESTNELAADKPAATPTSNTNVQVAGIDEGDQLKSDGEYLYFSRENDLLIVTAGSNESNVISTITEKNFQPLELYLHDNYLISIGHSYKPIRKEDNHSTKQQNSSLTRDIMPHHSQTTVFIYDISNKENPERIREVTLEGNYSASRKTDNQLYLIANEQPDFRILEEADSNPEIRPFIKDTAADAKDGKDGKPINYDDMYFFPESEEKNFLLFTSIDLNNINETAKIQSYLGASHDIYMSKRHMYIAVAKYQQNNTSRSEETATMIAPMPVKTEIMQFAVDNGNIEFQASTTVPGTLINQFAMDERKDNFRVATTNDRIDENENTTNNLYTFDLELNRLGSIEGLAKDERIYSVRFMDNVAYMVTFKQIDPLFVIDLKDPKNPNVLGELKIPGFSNYLHPLGKQHVIGFGMHTEVDNNTNHAEPLVQTGGIKISIFDVSNPTKPKETFSKVIGEKGSFTELNHNHKALYQHPDKNLFGFPVTLFETKTVQEADITYEKPQFLFEGALLLNISSENGIQIKESITHQKQENDHPEWESETRRMASIDNVLYTFSYNQMKVYDMNSDKVIHTLNLPDQPNVPTDTELK